MKNSSKQISNTILIPDQWLKGLMVLTLLLPAVLSTGCMSAFAAKPSTEELSPKEKTQQAKTMVTSADTAWRAGDEDQALMDYLAAMQLDPDNALIRYRIAVLQDKRGNWQAAQRSYTEVLKLQPAHAGAHEGMGIVLIKQQQLQKAITHLEQAVATDTQRWRAYNGLGVIADLQHRSADAVGYYNQAVALQPKLSMLHSNLGYSSYMGGDYPAALAHIERALKADPDNKTAWANLALIKVRMGKGKESVQAFTEIMEPYRAHNNVGYLFYMSGDEASARNHLNQAIDLSPSYYTLAQHNLDRLAESE